MQNYKLKAQVSARDELRRIAASLYRVTFIVFVGKICIFIFLNRFFRKLLF